MPYPWECFDCEEYNEYLVNNNKFYCKKMRMEVSINERSCNTYFIKRDKNKKFERPNTGCYLTTAMCEVLGFDDHCEILETLRNYRDEYMMNTDFGLALLHDYNTVGPKIADKIHEDEEQVNIAITMLNSYIKPAIAFINKNDNETALMVYETMTLDLMDYYGLDYNLLTAYEKKGKTVQRKREITY